MSAPKAQPVLKNLRAIAQVLIETPHMGKTFTNAPGTAELEVVKYKADRIFNPESPHPEECRGRRGAAPASARLPRAAGAPIPKELGIGTRPKSCTLGRKLPIHTLTFMPGGFGDEG